MIRDTSLKAYLNEVSPTLGARQIAVLEAFEQMPGRDFTNKELARALDWEINRVTPRVLELRELGILEESRKRMCSIGRREAHAWRIKGQPAVSSRAISPVPNRYQMPSLSQPGKTYGIVAGADSVKCACKGFTFRGHCSHIEKLRNATPKYQEITEPML